MYKTIARLCKERNITIAAMCREIDLQQSVISDLKHGRAKMLSIGTAARIADYFGVTVDALLNSDLTERTAKIPRYREFRENKKYSLGEAQYWTGIPSDVIERIEVGDEIPTSTAVRRLAMAYSCSVDELSSEREGHPLQYKERSYATERQKNVDSLTREILRISHEHGLSLSDIKTACDRCERFVLQAPVPEDSRGWISRDGFF